MPKRPPTRGEIEVMASLVEGPLHGYGIMAKVAANSGGSTRLGPGTLYAAIKRLTDRGWIEECEAPAHAESSDERRRYYQLTGSGEKTLREELRLLQDLITASGALRQGARP